MSSVIAGPSIYKQPAALRFEVFTCGAILGRSGHRLVLHMIGAVTHNRKPLFVNLLATTRFELFSPVQSGRFWRPLWNAGP